MVDFDLTEEQNMLIQLAEQFADEELIPKAEEWDREGIFPEKSIHKARELGLLNCTIPQEYGGMGLSYLDEVMINEELGRGDPGFATITGVTMLACHPIIIKIMPKKLLIELDLSESILDMVGFFSLVTPSLCRKQ